MKTKLLVCIVAVLLLIVCCVLFFMPKNNAASIPSEETMMAAESMQETTAATESTQETTVATEAVPSTPADELAQVETAPLPQLHLNGNISEMHTKSDERIIAFSYDDGSRNFDGYLEIKIQGNSSLAYEKKNYTIKMYQDEACEDKLKVDFGWGEESKYCLKANWIDQTHARNIVTARIASDIQQKYGLLADTPANGLIDGFPVEVYNNGQFLGLYTWNIPKDAWLVNMDGDNSDHIVVCGDSWEMDALFREVPNFTSWEIEVGEETPENLSKLTRLFEFVMYSSDEEFVENIDAYLNLDSVLNYYLVADMAYLRDNLGKNMLLFTYDSETWYMGLYDLDTSWGVNYDGLTNMNDLIAQAQLPLCLNYLFQRIETCFGEELANRYFELRESIFTKEYIMAEFNAFRDAIPEDVFAQEAARWENIPGFSYEQIEDYLNIIIPTLDEKYANLDQWILENEQRAMTYAEVILNTPAT